MKSLFFAGLATLAAAGAAMAQPENSTVTVNAGTTVRTFDDRLAGINTATWDNSTLIDAASNAVVQAADTRLMRFPGGSSSDLYHWQTNESDGSGTYQGVSFDQFETQLAQPNHIQSIITTNYGSGTPQEAAGWVAYSLAKGYNVKYWEIGNECYGTWENDTNTPEHDPLEYATRAIQYLAAMKQADPTARVGVVLALGEDNYPSTHVVTNPVTKQTHSGWDAVVLSTLAAANVAPDFVIYHNYPYNPGQETDTGLMQVAGSATQGWVAAANTMQAEVTDYLGANGAKVEMLNTENNSVSSAPGKQSVSLVNGLYMADSLGFISQSGFNGWIWWGLYNGNETDGNLAAALYGWRQYGDYGIVETAGNSSGLLYFPSYYVAKILSHFARAGDRIVSASSSLPQLLDVFGAKRADGSLSLLIVNKSIPTSGNPGGLSVTGSFTLNGFSPAGSATQYQYGVPQDNEAKTDTTNSVDPGTDAAADVQTSTVGISGPTFTMTFPAASVTLLSIPAAQQPAGTARLVNISSLGLVQGTTKEMVGGFSVGGSGTEEVLIRAIGPGLGAFPGIATPVSNVNLTVYDHTNTAINSNNGWSGGTAQNTQQLQAAFSQTGAFSLTTGSMDSALLLTLSPGTYTAVINGVGGASGTGMVEIYEVAANGTRLLNLSSSAYVDSGANILTGGLTVGGTGPEKVIIRGIGPALANFNETSYVSDPALKVIPSGGAVISANDDWSDSANSGLAAAFQEVGAFALTPQSRDAAVLLTLNPGGYSAQVYGTDGNDGTGLVEVYEVPAP